MPRYLGFGDYHVSNIMCTSVNYVRRQFITSFKNGLGLDYMPVREVRNTVYVIDKRWANFCLMAEREAG
jgi:hypothetical protein